MAVEFDLLVKGATESGLLRKALRELARDYRDELDEHAATASKQQRHRWQYKRRKCGDLIHRIEKAHALARLADSAVIEDEKAEARAARGKRG